MSLVIPAAAVQSAQRGGNVDSWKVRLIVPKRIKTVELLEKEVKGEISYRFRVEFIDGTYAMFNNGRFYTDVLANMPSLFETSADGSLRINEELMATVEISTTNDADGWVKRITAAFAKPEEEEEEPVKKPVK